MTRNRVFIAVLALAALPFISAPVVVQKPVSFTPGDNAFCADFQTSSGTCTTPNTGEPIPNNPSAACNANLDPWSCCTGAGAGVTCTGNWLYGTAAGFWSWASNNQLRASTAVGGQGIGIYSSVTDTSTQCVCGELGQNGSDFAGVLVRAGANANAGTKSLLCSIYGGDFYLFEFDGASYSADLRFRDMAQASDADDVICCSVHGGAGAEVFRMWFYNEGNDAEQACSGTCLVGDAGAGCTNSWDCTSAGVPLACCTGAGTGCDPNSATATQTHCGVGTQDASGTTYYDSWYCGDWTPP